MIQAIGVMVGAYIMVRMIELMATTPPGAGKADTFVLKFFAVVTLFVALACTGLVLFGSATPTP